MTISLLVPCFNAERFLPRLSDQVARLHPAFDEILLADDGSSDATATTAESLGFRIIRLGENRGPGAARNALAQAASCEWLHFHDVDDEIAPDYVGKVAPLLGPEIDALLHPTDFIEEATRAPVIRWQCDQEAVELYPDRTLLQWPLPTMSSTVRRSTFLDLGGFDEEHRCWEDGDFHFRLGATSYRRIRYLDEVLETSLRHENGAGSNRRYCACCRVEFLERYVFEQPLWLRPTIASEAAKLIPHLLRDGDRKYARRALLIAQKLGLNVPVTNNPVLRRLGSFAPLLAVRLQDGLRRVASR